jgi:hypothetical protein
VVRVDSGLPVRFTAGLAGAVIGVLVLSGCGSSTNQRHAAVGSSSAAASSTAPSAGSASAASPPAGSAAAGSAAASSGGKPSGVPGTRATTPVPAPGRGNIDQIVPSAATATLPASPLTGSVVVDSGVSVRLDGVTAITAKAQLPGEISGPAIEITVRVLNTSTQSISLNDVVVNATDSTGVPGVQMSASPAAPFPASVAAGQQATGIYVFTLGTAHRDPVSITVSYRPGAPVALFTGNVG